MTYRGDDVIGQPQKSSGSASTVLATPSRI
jgi:hypothetical protein